VKGIHIRLNLPAEVTNAAGSKGHMSLCRHAVLSKGARDGKERHFCSPVQITHSYLVSHGFLQILHDGLVSREVDQEE